MKWCKYNRIVLGLLHNTLRLVKADGSTPSITQEPSCSSAAPGVVVLRGAGDTVPSIIVLYLLEKGKKGSERQTMSLYICIWEYIHHRHFHFMCYDQ